VVEAAEGIQHAPSEAEVARGESHHADQLAAQVRVVTNHGGGELDARVVGEAAPKNRREAAQTGLYRSAAYEHKYSLSQQNVEPVEGFKVLGRSFLVQ
jgi:hypothetical protein